jgi:hypothetical protein
MGPPNRDKSEDAANRHAIEAYTLVEQISKSSQQGRGPSWLFNRFWGGNKTNKLESVPGLRRKRRAYKYPRATFAKIPHRLSPAGFTKPERNHLLDGIIGKTGTNLLLSLYAIASLLHKFREF